MSALVEVLADRDLTALTARQLLVECQDTLTTAARLLPQQLEVGARRGPPPARPASPT